MEKVICKDWMLIFKSTLTVEDRHLSTTTLGREDDHGKH